jgi:hypothetical protein
MSQQKQIARIGRMQEVTRKFVAEQHKLARSRSDACCFGRFLSLE